MSRIAVVDDDPDWGALMLRVLKDAGHEASHYATPGRFFDSLLKSVPDVLLLDMRLPGMHGREVMRVLRANDATRRLFIVAVSGHDKASAEAVKAFENGADEYLAKPVDSELLLARITALVRRGVAAVPGPEQTLRVGTLCIWPEQRAARIKDKEIDLTHLEFDLLVYFVRQPNRVLTRSLILEAVWGAAPELSTRTVDKHVETLRRKLGPLGAKLETVIRVGYMMRL